jgi:CIC family chloride channel protein
MGTLFAGIIRAPMTSVFMIFEITQDYQILVPLMLANMLSFMISKRYQPAPVYHALLQQDGVHLPSPATAGAESGTSARHVMQTGVSYVDPDLSVDAAWQWAAAHDAPAYLVGTPDRLLGIINRAQLESSRAAGHAADPVRTVVTDAFVHAHPDHPIDVVLERLAESQGLLPVVSRAEAGRVEGVITADSILSVGGGLRRRRASADRRADPLP